MKDLFTASEIRKELMDMLPLVIIAQHGTKEERDEALYRLFDDFRDLLGKTEKTSPFSDDSVDWADWDDYVEVILAEKQAYIGVG